MTNTFQSYYRKSFGLLAIMSSTCCGWGEFPWLGKKMPTNRWKNKYMGRESSGMNSILSAMIAKMSTSRWVSFHVARMEDNKWDPCELSTLYSGEECWNKEMQHKAKLKHHRTCSNRNKPQILSRLILTVMLHPTSFIPKPWSFSPLWFALVVAVMNSKNLFFPFPLTS